MANRFSTYSNGSNGLGAIRSAAQQTTQVSTTTLLNALHTIYASGQTYQLDASTSLAINTWLTAVNPDANGRVGGAVDVEIVQRAWEHARRRAEDGCIVLGSLHASTPSLFGSVLRIIPLDTPSITFTALTAIRPFLTCATPQNPATGRHAALAATYTTSLSGKLTALTLSLSTLGIDVKEGLLQIPSKQGYRAFDVFYYLLSSASTPAEREFLSLKAPSSYQLLKRSGTYSPPSYLATADDAAAGEDFRTALKAIGIKGAAYRGLLSTLAALLKLGETAEILIDSDALEEICEDIGGLIGLDPEVLIQSSTADREVFITAVYEALVDWVISKANQAIAEELCGDLEGNLTPDSGTNDSDEVSMTVMEIPGEALGKAVSLRGIFDDTTGINAEMKEDGVEVISAGHSVLMEMNNAVAEVAADLEMHDSPQAREREHERERKEAVLEQIGSEAEEGGFLRMLLYRADGQGLNLGNQGRIHLGNTLASSRVWYQLSLHPTDDLPSSLATLASTTSAWSAGTVSRQLRAWRLPEWANRRNRHIDFTADFDVQEFHERYARLGCKQGRDGVETFMLERGWTNGEVILGNERIWMREGAWWEAESMVDMKADGVNYGYDSQPGAFPAASNPFLTGYSAETNGSGFFPPMPDHLSVQDSRDNLLVQNTLDKPKSLAPTAARTMQATGGGDYGLGAKGDETRDINYYYDHDLGVYVDGPDPEFAVNGKIQTKRNSAGRQIWISIVYAITWFIPSFVLRYIGGMRRHDVRLAWREKVVLCLIIVLINCTVVFYIVEFGRLLCPNFDKAWNAKEVGYHTGDNDFYVSFHGKVYDITKFWRLQHSDTSVQTTSDVMEPFAGTNMDAYIQPPLSIACPGFNVDEHVELQQNNTDAILYPEALHTSGPIYQTDIKTALHSWHWYDQKFLPKMKTYYKGDLVVTKGDILSQGQNDQRMWAIINDGIYDLTNYFYTLNLEDKYATYQFLPSDVTDLFQNNPGEDITSQWQDTPEFENSLNCLNNVFYVGKVDFRKSAKCQVNNYILLGFTCILCTVILTKFLAALQFGSKRRPAPQDKFVICQVPAYTEGEDHLRKSIDSLTALQYDNKRKLICLVCDGMITGGGNDRPTPKIVLDILGVDPKVDPPALPFKSVGNGNEKLNYGKIYSGLYEYEGNVVPYLVIVKVGKESEQTKHKPGNRGKRDSQILLMQFLNRVHHRSPMSPLELEMFHQINNVIGVDPELYEYMLMVDADTMVREDSLNRLVANCANDAKIAGICGETSLENQEQSWWTMIQVYEYFISHHLAKAFESLFGSVTCLPGCFCMYRLRTADKGRPLIISDKVIAEYSDCDVDTLHKKNLLALGEDRYLTTLMTKHFPNMSYKFVPDAYALTAAPETWSVLLSQRRRWINSTIHNLAELVWLKDLCGFCCFSMRFVVFIDLMGTVILPATCAYLAYLIYEVASRKGQFPLISIIMIAAVYGLQAIIFIVKRQWQHVGWMIIYILAYPVYSFILPVYSFWRQDDFSWGNTRIVLGEKGDKKVIAQVDEFDPRSIPMQHWDDYALANNLPGRRGGANAEKGFEAYTDEVNMEMDDMRSIYSSAKPQSTILGHQQSNPFMAPPQSPSPYQFMANNRASTMTGLTQFRDAPVSMHGRQMSIGSQGRLLSQSPVQYNDQLPSGAQRTPYQSGLPYSTSRPSLLGMQSSTNLTRPASTIDFRTAVSNGPSDEQIVETVRGVLAEVDLDNVTKKQVRALVEQRLQNEVPAGERKSFLDRAIDDQLANM